MFDKFLINNVGSKLTSFRIDKKKVEEDKRFDGKWVLQTNTDLSSAEVALKYKELWQVEQVFRDMKSILVTRPIFHKMDETSEAMYFVAFWRCVATSHQVIELRNHPGITHVSITICGRKNQL